MALGSLVVELSANVAKFQSDFNRASQIAQDKLQEIDKFANIAKNSLASIGVGLVAGFGIETLKSKIEAAIESAGDLKQLSERTGAAVENLSALSAVAKLSNTDNEALAGGLQKLSKAMIDAANGGAQTTAAFKAIGISTADIANQKPDAVFLKIANGLAEYQDGASKTAIAQILLGKSGANLLPVFNDLAEVGSYQVRVTQAQAEAADEYDKNLKRLDASTNAVYKRIGLELVPVFNAFTKALLEAQTANNGLRTGVDDLARDGSIRSWAEGAAQAVGFVIDAFDAVYRLVKVVGIGLGATAAQAVSAAKLDFAAVAQIERDATADIDNVLLRETFGDRLKKQFEAARQVAETESRKQLPNIKPPKFDASGGAAGDSARAQLESQLKPLEAFIAQEKKLLDARNKDLDALYKLDQLSISTYFADKQANEQAYLAKVTGDYQQELAVLEKFAKTAKDQRTRIETETKIADVRVRATEAADESARRSADLIRQQAAETEKYRQEVEKLDEQLLRLQGNTAKATELSFDQANAALKRRATVENDQGTLDKLANVRALTVAQAQLNELDQQASLIQNQLGAAEQRINLEQQLGVTNEFQGAIKLGDKRREAIEQLAQIADKMDAVAAASGDPRLIQNAEDFRLKLDELRASADVLGQKLESIFEGTFSNALTDFITGTKSAGDAFKSFIGDINKQIASLVSQQLSKQLFQSIFGGASGGGGFGGGGGGGFNFGSLLSLFNSSGGGGDANGAAADALVNSTSALLGFAGGGRPPLGRASIVGENGPELFVPDTAGLIVPGGKIGAQAGQNITVSQQFTVMAPEGRISRQSDTQLRTLAASSLRNALARNG